MNDTTLLALFSKREVWLRFQHLVKEHAMSKDCWDIYKSVENYYKSFPSKDSIDWGDFTTFYFMHKGKVTGDKATIIRAILERCATESAALAGKKPEEYEDMYAALYQHYVKLDYLARVTEEAIKASTTLVTGGDAVLDKINSLMEQCNVELGKNIDEDSIFVPRDISSVLAAVRAGGLNWPLEELNAALGPARKGDFIIVAARPETGKTTLTAQIVGHFSQQLPKESGPIVWVNNEEASRKVQFRIVQSYFGVTTEELDKNEATYSKRYNDEVGDKILVLADDAGYNSVPKLTALFKKLKPSVIIIDQLDKVSGFHKEDREDLRIGRLYAWGRDLAKTYGVVIAVSQIDASGEGQEYITMNQLRGSKTDKAGEADAIVTIGKSGDAAKRHYRFIHIPKNKLAGGGSSKEEYRHGYFETTIKAELGRYISHMKGK